MAELFDNQSALATVPAQALEQAQPTSPMQLIQQALTQGVSPEVVRELVALQQSMERFNWEREERQAKIDFDTALNECQAKIDRIKPNRDRENGIKWADYIQVDKTVRPLYIDAGFSICFSEVDSTDKGKLKMCATVSRGGISREYFAETPSAPANSKMSGADGYASAASRVKRYLLLDIFNIAVGIDKDEKDGIPGLPIETYAPLMEAIENAQTVGAVTAAYIHALKLAKTEAEKQAFEKAATARKQALK